MKFLVQRVLKASVSVSNETIGAIDKGFLVFIGIEDSDTKEIADKMVKKLIGLRIFDDQNGKTNLAIKDEYVDGSLLLISQFTLYADCSHGNRPSFINAGKPEYANALYEYIISKCREELPDKVETGSFGAEMIVNIVNDGPFTIMLDSKEVVR